MPCYAGAPENLSAAAVYGLRMAGDAVELQASGRTVRISSPGRVYFPARGETKLDLARYYLSVGDGIVRALRERPCMLHRFPAGVSGEKVHQKRVPAGAPLGMRFWCTFSPATPAGNRCSMHGRSRSARTMPSPTDW